MQKFRLGLVLTLVCTSSFAFNAQQLQHMSQAFTQQQHETMNKDSVKIVYGGEDVANYPLLSMNSKHIIA